MRNYNLHRKEKMKKEEFFGDILFLLTLISPFVSLVIIAIFGEPEIFSALGMTRYIWIMLLFIPIGVLSILIGLKLKKDKQEYKKNIIVAVIVLPLLAIFGSYRFIDSSISYDTDNIITIENKMNIELPREIKIATSKRDSYDISYVKITDDKSKEKFEQEIKNNQLWEDELDFYIKSVLPYEIQIQSDNFEYFIFYNVTTGQYNDSNFAKGNYKVMFIAYDCDLQKLVILDNYEIKSNSKSKV